MLRTTLLLTLALGATALPVLAEEETQQTPANFGPLMSKTERNEHMEKMRSLPPEERFEYMQKHRAELQKRVEARMAAAAENAGAMPGSCGAPQAEAQRGPQWRAPQMQSMAPMQGFNPYYNRPGQMVRHYNPGYMMGPYNNMPNRMPMQMRGPFGNPNQMYNQMPNQMMGPYGGPNMQAPMMGPYGQRGPMMRPQGYGGGPQWQRR